jgi:hypothetical protein
MAPRILLSSKEFIERRLPRRGVTVRVIAAKVRRRR